MKRNLFSIGNGWALYMSLSVIKLLGFDPVKSKLLFTMRDKKLEITEIDENMDKDIERRLIRKFTKSGKGYAIYIPNSILELMEINPETDKIGVDVDCNVLKLKKGE